MFYDEGQALHRSSIVIDAVCPLALESFEYLEWYREGGVSTLAPTVGALGGVRETMAMIAKWRRVLADRDDLAAVRTVQDIVDAKAADKLGVYFHFQGIEPFEGDLNLAEIYKILGVGMVQLAYNVKNRVGDGCEERTDAGLSAFGLKLIERLNDNKIIVDCSHTGLRTSLEAVEASRDPVVLSHSNVASVHPSRRNVADELIDAVAKSGGVIGIVGFPAMVSCDLAPTLDQFINHVDAIASRVGIEHVALGLDYYAGQAGVASYADAKQQYDKFVEAGLWGPTYPPPPHNYPAGIETPKTLANLTVRLLDRGYCETEVRQVLGGNWMRVMQQVWG
ncbi:membrane dipeptidase [Sphingopyxis sp. JAI128]|uniref:membrane dipeptidase n=1 Tax=Sphingopyxis sp. JAI128 TaxID=2723066 RepID=UPI0016118F91|nr:membrane dipeptidase [Sphingopyxis sp. JAI128]MBB6428165.1 membrane dipeptidase [Sphingopyxis sp. JAI128]